MSRPPARVVPFPRERRIVLDSLRLGRRMDMVHGLLEIDVTEAWRRLGEIEAATGDRPSFTAWVVHCLARAVAAHPEVHAMRSFGRLVMFEDVDATTLVEVERDGRRFPLAHVLRGAQGRTVEELGAELRRVKTDPGTSVSSRRWRLAGIFLWVPGPLRWALYRLGLARASWRKRATGTVTVTAVGMFGAGSGWGIGSPTVHSLTVLVGSLQDRPRLVDGQVVTAKTLNLTVSLDHAVVDGGPAARFVRTLRELLEGASGL